MRLPVPVAAVAEQLHARDALGVSSRRPGLAALLLLGASFILPRDIGRADIIGPRFR